MSKEESRRSAMMDIGLVPCSSLLTDIATSGIPFEDGATASKHLPEPVPVDGSSIGLGGNQSAAPLPSGPLPGDVWTSEWYLGTVTGMAHAKLVRGCKRHSCENFLLASILQTDCLED